MTTTTYHIVVQKSDGTLTESLKDKVSSAIKSAKMYVTVRKEPAALVINNGKIIFAIPEEARNDTEFVKKALVKAKPRPSQAPAALPKDLSPASALPPDLKNFPVTAAVITKTSKAVKKEGVIIPETKPKIKACDVEVLESACITFSLSKNIPIDRAHKICEDSRDRIATLAGQLSQNKIDKDGAIQALISSMQGNRSMTSTNAKETKPDQPGIDVGKVMRGHRGVMFKPSRIREDIGMNDNLEDMLPASLPDGIVIYTTKETDDDVHGMLAFALGYTPTSLINLHHPSELTGFDFKRSIPLTRPTTKNPTWRGMGERIAEPGVFVKRIKEKYPDGKSVLVEVAQGIDL
jgi:hypothetical protein